MLMMWLPQRPLDAWSSLRAAEAMMREAKTVNLAARVWRRIPGVRSLASLK